MIDQEAQEVAKAKHVLEIAAAEQEYANETKSRKSKQACIDPESIFWFEKTEKETKSFKLSGKEEKKPWEIWFI